MCIDGHGARTDGGARIEERSETLDLESGLAALRSSPEFRGPVEALGDHDPNEHLAAIYESRGCTGTSLQQPV